MEVKLSKSEAKCLIKEKIMREWQQKWDTEVTGRRYYGTHISSRETPPHSAPRAW